jgi:serine/threonine protein kinase
VDVLGEGAHGKVFLATTRSYTSSMNNDNAQSVKHSKSFNGRSEKTRTSKVAIKVLDKNKIATNDTRQRQLISEIRVHWSLSKCDAVLQMLELYEDT